MSLSVFGAGMIFHFAIVMQNGFANGTSLVFVCISLMASKILRVLDEVYVDCKYFLLVCSLSCLIIHLMFPLQSRSV